ncbi:MAG: acetylglutamate kinase [Candidatus Sumerlaeia bacterium]|nr:acetylglutamate kinase [Candidatus Sumerlaeia bacterium]
MSSPKGKLLEDPALAPAIERARILAEALPYIQRFDNQTVVIKYGGHAMVDEELKAGVIHDVVLMESVGIRVVIVHGGGPEITKLMKKLGIQPQFFEGQRVTDEETLSVTQMVLDGKINGEIVNGINLAGGRAVGLSGKDAGLVLAKRFRPTGPDGKVGDIGYVGEVERVNPEILDVLDKHEFIPVVSPIGVDADGQTLNINADTVAAEIAAALKAARLILLTDVRGICKNPADPATMIPTIRAADCEALIRDGVISGGMIPKVRACLEALAGGVEKTHILDGRIPHVLLLELFTDAGIGTEIIS